MSDTEKKFYKSNVEIGGIIFEQIEYEDYSDSVARLREIMDSKFTLWDRITISFYGLKDRIKSILWKIRYGFQRMFKGYDSTDTFNTYYNFIERYTKILTEYKKKHWGHVATMTNEEWEAIIDKMLCHLHYMDEDNVEQELEKGVPDNWSANPKTIGEVINKHKDEFFKLFSEYFYDLWD